MPNLYIFDFDGTLVEQSTNVLLPGVHRWLVDNPGVQIAIASNQGGVGMRHWMETDGWGNPASYPTHEKIASNFKRFFSQIPNTITIAIYLCYVYQSKQSKKWSPVPIGSEDDPFWRQDWRKPASGMLLKALEDHRCAPEDAIMVGDRLEDMEAALAANILYMDANQFFRRS